ncbi:Arm DNA-binding domain-containing protein [Candidatus Pelagibacter ubique]|nr:Arm DNA-binding domain-containing protein [Candidatus Pelagibacter ubique]
MIEEVKKKKMSDMRVHLSDKVIKELRPKGKQYSKGDDEVVGLRVFVYPSGVKTFHYCYTDLDGKKQKERLESTSVINCVAARNKSRKIAAQVMEGIASSQIKRGLSTELTVSQLFEKYEKNRLRSPKYKPSTISKWRTYRKCWIDKVTDDKIIRGMLLRTKVDLGNTKLSKVNMDDLKEYHKFIGDKAQDSANSIIQMMSVVFNYAVEEKLVLSKEKILLKIIFFSIRDYYI